MVEFDPNVVALFDKILWGSIGHHIEITRLFSLSIKEDVAQIGGFQFTINEDKINEATKLPQTSECWFKG